MEARGQAALVLCIIYCNSIALVLEEHSYRASDGHTDYDSVTNVL